MTPLYPSKTIKNRLVGKLKIRCLCSPSFNLCTIMVIGTSNPQIIKFKLDSQQNPLYFQQLYLSKTKFNEAEILNENALSINLTWNEISHENYVSPIISIHHNCFGIIFIHTFNQSKVSSKQFSHFQLSSKSSFMLHIHPNI